MVCSAGAIIRGARVRDFLDLFFLDFDMVSSFDGEGCTGTDVADGKLVCSDADVSYSGHKGQLTAMHRGIFQFHMFRGTIVVNE